jgi:GAF domain-containing protein
VEPIPESLWVIRQQLERGDTNLSVGLRRISQEVVRIVPECVGFSLASLFDGITYTLVSTSLDVASLDAVQYLDGGPCVRAAHEGHTVESFDDDVLSEEEWQLYARSSAAQGVASSLTLPLTRDGRVIGTVNLYASTTDAFGGREEELARAIGASAADAVANADLSFSTRVTAQRGPEIFEDENDIDVAVAILSDQQGIDAASARERLRDAARRAGVSEGQAARSVRAGLPDRTDGE